MTIATSELSPFSEWYALRDELVPFIGERVFALFALAISDECDCGVASDHFRAILEASGNDLSAPQLTETEQLLIDWARAVAHDATSVDAGLQARFDTVFNPQLRKLLVEFAAIMVATTIVTAVG